ncbi:MAG: FecR domain-containing protein, partial [SAR324 cluster bacterium]|nr:FecR domain-containing protein [SAR324 cluster bacterium]
MNETSRIFTEVMMCVHKFFCYIIVCLLIVNGTIGNTLLYGNETAIASLGETEGFVEVIPARDKKSVAAKDGFLLYVGDVIKTQSDGEASVIFRSGSEIRLFEDTEFIVDGAKELSSEERSFDYKLSMKAGALWGNFVRGRQKTKINIGIATIGVKGTVFRLRDGNEKASLSVTEGKILVENEMSSITLEAGKRLNAFTKTDNLKD